jgi:hypothetical protein
MMRKTLFAVSILFGLVMLLASGQALAVPGGGTQTAQSVMVDVDFDSSAYQIEGTITWSFDRGTANNPGCAMGAYTNEWDGNNPTVSCTGGGTNGCQTAPTAPTRPAADALKVQQLAQAYRCTFFFGGDLSSDSYTKSANVVVNPPASADRRGNWTFTWTYDITPLASVPPKTCWTSVVDGGDSFVDVGFSGFISSESFAQINQGANNGRKKYSFTADNRVRNVVAQLQESTDGGTTWNDVGEPIPFGTDDGTGNYILAVTPTTADYLYYGNAGVFGNSVVYGYLHAPGYNGAAYVSAILLGPPDNFDGNDNDIANGNVHQANFGDMFYDLGVGDYRILLTGTIKGNDGISGFDFGVTSNLTEIGGCNN